MHVRLKQLCTPAPSLHLGFKEKSVLTKQTCYVRTKCIKLVQYQLGSKSEHNVYIITLTNPCKIMLPFMGCRMTFLSDENF